MPLSRQRIMRNKVNEALVQLLQNIHLLRKKAKVAVMRRLTAHPLRTGRTRLAATTSLLHPLLPTGVHTHQLAGVGLLSLRQVTHTNQAGLPRGLPGTEYYSAHLLGLQVSGTHGIRRRAAPLPLPQARTIPRSLATYQVRRSPPHPRARGASHYMQALAAKRV